MRRQKRFRLIVCVDLVLFISSFCIATRAQRDGYLSIDCGSSSDLYEDSLGLSWVNDQNFIRTGRNLDQSDIFKVPSSLDNSKALQNFRYFPDLRRKDCYNLPTSSHTSFLLRVMFFHGNSSRLRRPIKFNVSVNATIWLSVEYSVNDTLSVLHTPKVFEGIFNSSGSVVHFCLLRVVGVPFISSLELRELDPRGQMYSYGGSERQYLTNLVRSNGGARRESPTVRYPDDDFDRLWYTPGDWTTDLRSFRGAQEPTDRTNADVNNVPSKVMQDAWMYDAPNSSLKLDFGTFIGVQKVYAAVYVEEISPNASTSKTVRGFDVTLSGGRRADSVNATASPKMLRYFDSSLVNEEANFTFSGLPWSTLGPIVNAVEVYAQSNFDDNVTAPTDVRALSTIQRSFNLTDWQGDPCVPVSWDWVACNTATSVARVTKLFLSKTGIEGIIPARMSRLSALVEIHLDNNNLTGEIPDSLGDLEHLTLLSLQNNRLNGSIPSSLLNDPGLNFTYYGNPDLVIASSPSPDPVSSWGEPARGPTATEASSGSYSSRKGLKVAAIVNGCIAGGLLVLGIALFWFLLRKKRTIVDEACMHRHGTVLVSPRPQPLWNRVGHFALEEVFIATDNHANQIGEGSYGPVYYGRLSDGREVAVKVNRIHSNQGKEEFVNEIELLTRIHHMNLVPLIGYCTDRSTDRRELILMYEYQANGTLQGLLYSGEDVRLGKFLDWRTRLDIAWNAAKGLEYLHNGCNPRIIHRDVKSSNILLDSNMIAKVSDFGISQTFDIHTLNSSTSVRGTPGYLDPEYHQFQKLTQKSDVYSFGIVLLEIISGRPPFAAILSDRNFQPSLTHLLNTSLETNNIGALVDPALRDGFRPESMWRLAEVARDSIEPNGKDRPDMTQIVIAIAEARKLELSNWNLQAINEESVLMEGQESSEFPCVGTTAQGGTLAAISRSSSISSRFACSRRLPGSPRTLGSPRLPGSPRPPGSPRLPGSPRPPGSPRLPSLPRFVPSLFQRRNPGGEVLGLDVMNDMDLSINTPNVNSLMGRSHSFAYRKLSPREVDLPRFTRSITGPRELAVELPVNSRISGATPVDRPSSKFTS